MLGISVAVILAGLFVADAIMFVNGYKGYFHRAKTEQEKAVRRAWFNQRGIKWKEKQ
jgi:hypothetical protein